MATTDEKCLASAQGAESALPVEGPHGERRSRARELVSSQQAHLERLETELAQRLECLAEEVAQAVGLAEATTGNLDESAAVAALKTQLDALQQRIAALDAERDELRRQHEAAQLERGRIEQELRVRDALLKEAQGHDEVRRVELATTKERLADVEAQLVAVRARQSALEQELAAERERSESILEETKAQRRRIAREFKQQRAERNAELDRRKAELDSASGQNSETAARLATAQAELAASARELNDLRAALAERTQQVEQLQSAAPSDVDPKEVRLLQQERDGLVKRLAAAEAALEARSQSSDHDACDKDDLRRRFEMAVEEVRELKRENAELETKLRSRGTAAGPAPSGGGLDWEAQKQRLLASLEEDADDDEEAITQRSSIEGTIRITDQIVAQKDLEIAELKQMVESHGIQAASTGAAAAAELLDHDEVIRQEREKLAEMQAEWRKKFGQAEIDISVERAKIARERSELEEKLRQFQQELENRATSDGTADAGKPARGRWLARLGLKDIDET